ncbi:hypothetical protein [Fulvivirga lutea]|uniref:Uncharacterized protein n=1 Tax=Fulvivirga lutea TaxID=2810512 RepID=A0A974WGG4_9BACT|nr:hypothetical protein [Fulvivirga lutea]QSE97846.1 hypothetical protein JR347_01785 [Fulvivirga lutea]
MEASGELKNVLWVNFQQLADINQLKIKMGTAAVKNAALAKYRRCTSTKGKKGYS